MRPLFLVLKACYQEDKIVWEAMSMDSIESFTGKANDYTVGRPSYAPTLIEYLYSEYGLSHQSIIADIGSGTGKFAKQLLDQGSFVYGVEPNEDMRRTAANELGKYPRFQSINGTASESTIDDASVDFVTAAQAFHWFNVSAFRKECTRILKPNGNVILIWNMRDMSADVNSLNYDIISKYCPRFRGFSNGIKVDDERITRFFNGNYDHLEFDNPLFYDKGKFIRRSLSSSYSLQRGDENFQEYIDNLSAFFEQYAENNILEVPNQTVAYIGSLK